MRRRTSDHSATPQPGAGRARIMGRQQWVYRRSPAESPRLPQRLERLKDAAGLSWRGLARRLGVDARLLRRWRPGTRPDAGHLLALLSLAEELGLLRQLLPTAGSREPSGNATAAGPTLSLSREPRQDN